jgi:thiamine phosphate synthase YjbQ (UPF0047 family)
MFEQERKENRIVVANEPSLGYQTEYRKLYNITAIAELFVRDSGIKDGLFFAEARTSSASIFVDFPPSNLEYEELLLRKMELGKWLDTIMPDSSETDLRAKLRTSDYNELNQYIEGLGLSTSVFSRMSSFFITQLLQRKVILPISDGKLDSEAYGQLMFYDPKCSMHEFIFAFNMKAIEVGRQYLFC